MTTVDVFLDQAGGQIHVGQAFSPGIGERSPQLSSTISATSRAKTSQSTPPLSLSRERNTRAVSYGLSPIARQTGGAGTSSRRRSELAHAPKLARHAGWTISISF